MREKRYHVISSHDQRNHFEVDRDRVLYSSYFHRLAGVTQIVRAGEAEIFHTRQQHSHKVAQIGRRIAEKLLIKFPDVKAKLDPEVVEAACLAHDIGHPPFGHVGESELNQLVQKDGGEGYEGNAQTFRILTKLAVRYDEYGGLNLTRATLCAVLKYPWLRDADNADRKEKWSAYASEKTEFDWVRIGQDDGRQSLEAAIMDWADDIAYSVHDLEDFHRCNLIPWGKIFQSQDERDKILQSTLDKWHGRPPDAEQRLSTAFADLLNILEVWKEALTSKYDGSRYLRYILRNMTSILVGKFISSTELDLALRLSIDNSSRDIVILLKQMARDYIISNPALAAQQRGHRRIVNELYSIIKEDCKEIKLGEWIIPSYLPPRLVYLKDYTDSIPRFIADCIASLTEREATELHARLTGVAYGSVLDPIVR